MRKLISISLVLAVIFVLALPASAQDAMEEKIVCDSTLITLLYIAEHDYGYEPMMDVSVFEKGQYAPLFDAMMAMMEEGDMEEGEMAEGEMMEEGDMAEGEMMDDMVMLAPGVVAGEPAECTELRTSVETFIYEHLSMMMMDEAM